MKLLLFAPLLAACTALGGLTRLDEMGATELALYGERMGRLVANVAQAGMAEGDLTAEATRDVAEALEAVAAGTLPMAEIDLDGYGALILSVALMELEDRLADRGGLVDGVLSPEARVIVAAVAARLRGLQ